MNYLKDMGLDVWTAIDEIWNDTGISYWDYLYLYGPDRTKELVKKMPNMLKKVGGAPMDEAAEWAGFSSDDELGQALQAWISKKQRNKAMEDQYNTYLATIEEEILTQEKG